MNTSRTIKRVHDCTTDGKPFIPTKKGTVNKKAKTPKTKVNKS